MLNNANQSFKTIESSKSKEYTIYVNIQHKKDIDKKICSKNKNDLIFIKVHVDNMNEKMYQKYQNYCR